MPLNEQGLLGELTVSSFHVPALTRILPASLLVENAMISASKFVKSALGIENKKYF